MIKSFDTKTPDTQIAHLRDALINIVVEIGRPDNPPGQRQNVPCGMGLLADLAYRALDATGGIPQDRVPQPYRRTRKSVPAHSENEMRGEGR